MKTDRATFKCGVMKYESEEFGRITGYYFSKSDAVPYKMEKPPHKATVSRQSDKIRRGY